MLSPVISSDFEHIYLIGPDSKQLKIKFNSQISNLKNTILESKIDTIGSTYPFVFRNKIVKYKEFSLSGLISYLSDENETFLDRAFDETYNDFNLTASNTYKERIFKNEVLEWLNNGDPKILKTPTEGIFIVRLMNVSLSPESALKGMIHNFSATAYEIAEFNQENLNNFKFLITDKITENANQKILWKSFNLMDNYDQNTNFIEAPNQNTNKIQITNALPGTCFSIRTSDREDAQIIMIGLSGHYELDLFNTYFTEIKVLPKTDNNGITTLPKQGILTLNKQVIQRSLFDIVDQFQYSFVPAETLYGSAIKKSVNQTSIVCNKRLIEDELSTTLKDFKLWTYLRLRTRPIEELSTQPASNTHITENDIYVAVPYYPLYSYQDKLYEKYECYLNNNRQKTCYHRLSTDDKKNKNVFKVLPLYYASDADSSNITGIDLREGTDYLIPITEEIKKIDIEIGPGLAADVGYRAMYKSFSINDTDYNNYKKQYQNILDSIKINDNKKRLLSINEKCSLKYYETKMSDIIKESGVELDDIEESFG